MKNKIIPSAFPHMCITAIANLMQASIKEGNPRTMFSKDMDIIPFMESHWEGMTTMSRRVTQSWHVTVNIKIFLYYFVVKI
jgi:Set1/Ash2 histone methyltransferase complex subunit ASH2